MDWVRVGIRVKQTDEQGYPQLRAKIFLYDVLFVRFGTEIGHSITKTSGGMWEGGGDVAGEHGWNARKLMEGWVEAGLSLVLPPHHGGSSCEGWVRFKGMYPRARGKRDRRSGKPDCFNR
jgi:hypothetical protein